MEMIWAIGIPLFWLASQIAFVIIAYLEDKSLTLGDVVFPEIKLVGEAATSLDCGWGTIFMMRIIMCLVWPIVVLLMTCAAGFTLIYEGSKFLWKQLNKVKIL